MRLFLVVLGVVFVFAQATPIFAAGFSRVGTFGFTTEGIFAGGRLSALGGSDLADGSPAALVINPAPLARGNSVELSYDHANYYSGTNFRTNAGSVELKNWRLNFAMHDYFIDDQLVRTAYNPEGTGRTFDMLNRMTIMGVSYDLGRSFFNSPSLQWSVGASWRHYLTDFDDSSNTSDSYDLGTTFSYTTRYSTGWTRVSGAVSWQNLNDSTFVFDERESYLPQPLRVGTTIETAFDWTGHRRPLVKLLLAFTRSFQKGTTYLEDTEQAGMEAVFFDALALRWGHNSRVAGDIASWGAGIIISRGLLGPFSVRADVGEMGYDNMVLNDSETIWGVRVGYAY